MTTNNYAKDVLNQVGQSIAATVEIEELSKAIQSAAANYPESAQTLTVDTLTDILNTKGNFIENLETYLKSSNN
jgi:hypothetical protein